MQPTIQQLYDKAHSTPHLVSHFDMLSMAQLSPVVARHITPQAIGHELTYRLLVVDLVARVATLEDALNSRADALRQRKASEIKALIQRQLGVAAGQRTMRARRRSKRVETAEQMMERLRVEFPSMFEEKEIVE